MRARELAIRLLRVARPSRGLLLLGALATIVASLFDGLSMVLLVPLLKILFNGGSEVDDQLGGGTTLQRFVDQWIQPLVGSGDDAKVPLLLLLVTTLILKSAFSYGAAQSSVYVQERLVRDLRSRLYRHLLTIDLGFFQQTKQGHLISGVIADADQSKQAVSAILAQLFQNLVMITVLLLYMWGTSWRLTVLILAAAPVLVIGIRQLLKRLRRHAREWADERGALASIVSERLAAMKLIRGYGAESNEAARFEDQANRYRKRVVRTQRYAMLTSPVSEIFGGLLIVIVMFAASETRFTGVSLSAAVFVPFLIAALRLMSPIKSISQFPAAIAVALASAERVFGWLDLPAKEVDRPDARPATFHRDLVFDQVSFAYQDELVLDRVSFEIAKGQMVAIVGPSGSGKTTLLELVPRFYDPRSGEIRLDGVPLGQLTRASLRGLIGLVSQDTVVLNETVAVNIAYGCPGASREAIRAAAQAANALEFIERLPQGFDTVLGERGARLSGGQRQRIAIARALLRDPPLLILDEATSALDTESERLVQEAIDRLMQDRTVLVVAHRLATVRHADEILVLDQGRIVERGSHEALMAQGGLYRRLHDLQFRNGEEAHDRTIGLADRTI